MIELFIGAVFALVGVGAGAFSGFRRRELSARTERLCRGAPVTGSSRLVLEGREEDTEGRETELELLARVRDGGDRRERFLAFDELVRRFDLDMARHRLDQASLGRLVLLSSAAGAIFELAFGALEQARWFALGLLLLAPASWTFVARQAAVRKELLERQRSVLKRLRRELVRLES